MKKMRAIAVIMAAIMAVPTMPAGLVYAEEAEVEIEAVAEPGADIFDFDGYKLKWEDNFDGTTLDKKAWNVELHEKGWVNDEWQEYIDDESVLEVSDGTLKIKPVKETERIEIPAGEPTNLFPEDVTINQSVTFENMGANPWNLQKIYKVAVESGKKYKVTFTASSTVARTIVAGVQKQSGDYDQYGQKKFDITTEENEYSYEFTSPATDASAGCYFNFGKDGDTPESDVVIKNISMIEVGGGNNKTPGTYTNLYPAGKTINETVTIENMKSDPWDFQILDKIALEGGKTYKLTFTASSTVARNIVAGIQNTSTYAQYVSKGFDITTEPTEYSLQVAMEESDATAGVYFNLGKTTGVDTPESDITITDISLIDVNEEIGGGYTNLYPAGKTINETVTIENMKSDPWDFQILDKIALEGGKTYKLTFTASSTVARNIVAGIQNTSTYAQYVSKGFDITTEPTEYSLQLTMEESDATAGVYFNLGKTTGVDTPESDITITDISLVDVNEDLGSDDDDDDEGDGEPTYKEVNSYYSGRISTQNKKTYTYGYFECRAKVPAGQGYLPAFWLMANDENIYGQWPQCGEIDAMEIWGSKTNEVLGTIHYGKPHQENQGSYTITEGPSFSDEFHTFGVEWVPGRITWYVDGVKFHEAQNWYSKNENDTVPTSYPAPFDQDFYVILNLAIGNNWAGRPDETTVYEGNNFEIDYVKVYQKDSYDDSDIDEPEVPFAPKHEADENGNFVINGNFATPESLDDDGEAWVYLVPETQGGAGSATIADNKIDIEIEAAGSVDYAIQLVQAELPFEKGAEYEVSYKAWADKERTMNVDIKAPDHGYMKYMDTMNPELTTEAKTFTTKFKMTDASDDNGRLEFNMGAAETGHIYITDVVVKKTKDADPNEKEVKTVTSDGNYIYNGSFAQGKGGLLEWTATPDDKSKLSVSGVTDGRRLVIAKGTDASIEQDDLAFVEGTQYLYSMEVDAAAAVDVKVTIGGVTNTIKATKGKKTYSFVLPSTTKYADQSVKVALKAPATSDVKIDNLRLEEDMLLKNGSFTAGFSSYEAYVDSSASASYVVDSINNPYSLAFTIKNTGDEDWKIQLKQNNIKLEQGKAYRLKFKAKTTLEGGRDIRVIMQGLEPLGWPVYSGDDKGTYHIGADWTEFTNVFRMNHTSDAAAFLSVCLGNVSEQITTQHDVVLDDFSLEEIELPIYAVTFDGNGEEFATAPATQYIDKDCLATSPEGTVTSTNDAATFTGWFADAECTQAFDFDAPILKDTVVYAGWDLTADAKDDSIKVAPVADETYTGKVIKPAVVVTQYGKELVLNKDYKVTYKNNTKANKDGILVVNNGRLEDAEGNVSYSFNKVLPTIEIQGIGNYNDKITFNFNINPSNIDTAVVDTADWIPANTTKATALTYTVSLDGKKLAKTDYAAVLVATTEAKNAEGETLTEAETISDLKIPKGYTGKFELTLTGKGNYSGSVTKVINVDSAKTSISKAVVSFKTLNATGEALTADELKAVTTVKVSGKTLTADDYDVEFVAPSVVNAGSYQVMVTGKGDTYAGTKTATVKVTGIAISKATASLAKNRVFDGTRSGELDLALTYKATKNDDPVSLEKGKDYTVSVSNDLSAGVAKITISGIGKFTGTMVKTYTIKAFTLANNAEGLTYNKSLGNVAYIAKGATPDVNIVYNGVRLTNNVDYKLTYAKNAAVGEAKVTVTGKGNFNGKITDITFKIVPGDIKKAGTVITAADKAYANRKGAYAVVPKLTTASGKALAVNKDYSKDYKYELVNADGTTELLDKNSIPAANSTIKVTVYGVGGYTGFVSTTYHIAANNIAAANIKIKDKSFTGRAVTLTTDDIKEATFGKGAAKTDLTYGDDYVIESYANNVKNGTAKVVIRGLGNYYGTKTVTFKIGKRGFLGFLR